jgi:hypothetical protein
VARAASLLDAKDPDLRLFGGVPSVAALVDTPEAHALDADVAAAEAAAVSASRAVGDPAAEARARAAVDERALAQARAAAAGFAAFTGHLAAAADAGRQAELAERAAARLKEAEAAGEEGRVDDAQRLMEEAEQLKRVAATPAPVKLPGQELVRGGGVAGAFSVAPSCVRFRSVFLLFLSSFCARGGALPRALWRARGGFVCGGSGARPPPLRAPHGAAGGSGNAFRHICRARTANALAQHARTPRPRGDNSV